MQGEWDAVGPAVKKSCSMPVCVSADETPLRTNSKQGLLRKAARGSFRMRLEIPGSDLITQWPDV